VPQAAGEQSSPGAQETDEFYDPFAKKDHEEAAPQIADPLSPWNKLMYHFNDKFYFWFLKPVTQGYKFVIPVDFRIAFSNFYENITTPIRFVNSLLQLKVKAAGNELLRLVINSTAGGFGLNDVATKLDIKKNDEDLDQTLGKYGIGQGIYIVWPILGPSSLRGSIGSAGDFFLNPISYVTPLQDSLAIRSHDAVNDRSFKLGDYESLKESAVDPYVALRDAYVQHRKKKVEE
jgi:phospholipid-binding lipoprotein MlaA